MALNRTALLMRSSRTQFEATLLSWRSSSPWWPASPSRTTGSPTPSISLRGAQRCSCCSRSACGCRCTCAAGLRRSRRPASLSPPPVSDCSPISRCIGTTVFRPYRNGQLHPAAGDAGGRRQSRSRRLPDLLLQRPGRGARCKSRIRFPLSPAALITCGSACSISTTNRSRREITACVSTTPP